MLGRRSYPSTETQSVYSTVTANYANNEKYDDKFGSDNNDNKNANYYYVDYDNDNHYNYKNDNYDTGNFDNDNYNNNYNDNQGWKKV